LGAEFATQLAGLGLNIIAARSMDKLQMLAAKLQADHGVRCAQCAWT
jgi:short-subunit dehydrogenase